MEIWLPVVARVGFYAGGEANTSPRWLFFGGRRFRVEVLHQVRVGSCESSGEVACVWLVQATPGIFRVQLQGGHMAVSRWQGPEPPRGLADLLA
ncbi:MAG: hypothetical protein ACUVRY_05240 [Thermoanaerobaculaceae bacterium]